MNCARDSEDDGDHSCQANRQDRPQHNRKKAMAGILDFTGAAPRGGVLPFANTYPIDDNRNAILGYLAGALQGGNLGHSIGHGLAGWLTGERLDQRRLAPGQTYRALAEAGVPDPVAKAAALNPHVMRTVAPAYFAPQPFKDVASLNAVIGRLGDLMTAADKRAGIAPRSASSDPQAPALPDVALARSAVTDDMAHVLRSGGMSEDDIRAWKDALESSASADELKAVIGRGIELVNARLADLQTRYRRGVKAPPELLSPKSRATLDKLQQWSAPAAGSMIGKPGERTLEWKRGQGPI